MGERLSRLERTVKLWRRRVTVPPGHYYSPLTSTADADMARNQRQAMEDATTYDLRAEDQLALAEAIGPTWGAFRFLWSRYTPKNEWFDISDAAVYHSMLAKLQPKRVIEIGSGFSSAVALDARDNGTHDAELTFIEPYPQRLLELLSGDDRAAVTLHRNRLQDVPLTMFTDLNKNDILFVDSTHVSKAGSDVNWLFFHVLPRLKPGVVIHIHDIHFPFEYIDSWLDEGRSWNELYMLRAFLSYNDAFQILFFNSWVWQKHPEVVRRYLPEAVGSQPGSIWLRRVS